MATLVLTAVGYAVGGPIGAAVGSLIGQQADAAIFAPKGRQGPRLGELAVQTSSYGTAIPKIFGTMRVAGTVIWATDLKEEKSVSGGGKGRPKTTSYSYSASFAVALSARPLRAIKRIWADGKLLRGAAGDFKSATGFRFYPGDEEQPVDPLIAAVEGIGQAPAFRGVAYALFEDFQLADYGNRIPSLTFEVEADAGAVTIGGVAAELSDDAVAAGETPSVAGYAASGDSVRGAIEALSDLVPLSLVEGGGSLTITAAATEPVQLLAADLGARPGGAGEGGRSEFVRQAAGAFADEVSISYYDVARDYQTGLQRATRGGPGRRSDRRALPAALAADAAKAFAERRLSAHSAARARGRIHLGWRHSGIRPGAYVRVEGDPGIWRAARWTFERMVVALELVRIPPGSAAAPEASSGRPVSAPDLRHGPTVLRLLDLPFYSELAGDRPQLLAAAAGASAGWRRAELMASFDGGASWQPAGATAAPAVMGSAVTALGAGGSALFDRHRSVEVELIGDAMWLEGRSDAALVGGANLALLGDELIQFGAVEALGGRRFRLSRLLRGRRGTEWAAGSHSMGEGFLLIEPQSLAVIEPPSAAAGGEARLMGQGIDDEEAALANHAIVGEAMRPPSPVHLRARRETDGAVAIEWVRRSRGGWTWLSGSDTPLGEEAETYRLHLSGSGFERTVTLSAPAFVYSAAQQAADGAAGTISVSVAQIGTLASSRAAQIAVPIV